jgi:hypothetical protein
VEYILSKKIIQIPIDEKLLKELNSVSKKQRKARAELIREACAGYLVKIEQQELDRIYQQGYEDFPETPDVGEAQIVMLKHILPEENW